MHELVKQRLFCPGCLQFGHRIVVLQNAYRAQRDTALDLPDPRYLQHIHRSPLSVRPQHHEHPIPRVDLYPLPDLRKLSVLRLSARCVACKFNLAKDTSSHVLLYF